MRRLVIALLCLAGCKSDTVEAYNTLQECYDDHRENDMQANVEALLECCLDHPIMGVTPACTDTAPDCINLLTNEIDQIDASTVDIMEACMMYEAELAEEPGGGE